MKDYGGFGEEPFYDFDGDGKLDLIEESLMHADQYCEMMEMDNLSRSYSSSKRHKKGSFWDDFWREFCHSEKIINVPTYILIGILIIHIAEVYGNTGNDIYFILAIILFVCSTIGLFINKPQK